MKVFELAGSKVAFVAEQWVEWMAASKAAQSAVWRVAN